MYYNFILLVHLESDLKFLVIILLCNQIEGEPGLILQTRFINKKTTYKTDLTMLLQSLINKSCNDSNVTDWTEVIIIIFSDSRVPLDTRVC